MSKYISLFDGQVAYTLKAIDHTCRKMFSGENVEHSGCLRQITEQLAEIHSREEVYGKHPSSLAEILDSAGKLDISNEPLSEWRPAEETKTNSKPTKEGDVFSLGCYFYYVITGGQHPFGRSGQRALFIEKNLCNLAGCRDQQLQTLIARMISNDCKKRPNSSELLNHPFLWQSEKIEKYLTNVAENINENSVQYNKWKGTILLSDKSIGVNSGQKKTAVKVTNVAAVLNEIKEKKGNPTDLCQMFPNLLPSIYISENIESNEIEQEIDGSPPEIFNDLLVANGSFGEVESVTKIKRRHGRLGLQHVHVIQFQKDCDDIKMTKSKRLRYLSHPNCLQCFYLVANSSEICMAFEPFDETLETWLEKRERKQLEYEIINEILRQITEGIMFYHTNKLTHGNLSLSQIVIFEKGITVVAKVAQFSLSHVQYSSENSEATIKNDIRELGIIFSYLLSKSKQEVPQSHVHLIQAMKDLDLPSAASVLKHPFFWSPEMNAAFLVAASDYYTVQHPIFDQTSKLEIALSAPMNPVKQNWKTNRHALDAFSSEIDILTTEELRTLVADWTKQFPKLVFQTWLRLQQFKKDSSADENLDLSPFYHPDYDFPLYDELMCEEKFAINNLAFIKDTPPEKSELRSTPTEKEVIKNFLNQYVLQRKIGLPYEDQSSTRSLTSIPHPPIDILGRTAMHLACQSDDFYEPATALMKLGFDPNTKDSNGFVPLHVAAERNALKIAKLLIKNKAKLDIRDNKYKITPIFFAAISDSTEIVTLFVEKKAKIDDLDPLGRNPLHFAVLNNSLEAARILLEKGADVNATDKSGNSALHFAAAIDSVEMVQLLLNYKGNPNVPFPILPGTDDRIGCVLHLAVVKQFVKMVEVLLKGGADPNIENIHGETALHLAALQKNAGPDVLSIVNLLIKEKANPNATDNCDRTVLYAAIFNKAEEIAERLLKLDCSIEIVNLQEKDSGFTLLHIAAIKNFGNVVSTLIAKGAKIDAKDNNGLTPLEYAAALNDVNFVKCLSESDVKAIISRYQTKNIRSPLHVAAAYNAVEVGKLLISLGADINSVSELCLTPLHYAAYRKSVRFIEFLKAKQQENSESTLTPEASGEEHLRKQQRKKKINKHFRLRGRNQSQKRGNSPPQQQKHKQYLSKKLSAQELALIPQLINCFETGRISFPIPNININLPASVTQFNNFKMSVTQEIVMNFSPGQ